MEVAVVKFSAYPAEAHVVEAEVGAEQESFEGPAVEDPYLEGAAEVVVEEEELAWLVNGSL